ncbi:hypothetical protein DB30_03159 [Enhygromyxa salina]|uniref:Uncharacterized protein n=1 Tax=Enhygromyxa salina TaxID=215803 RepID=A0A0C2A226_9BACT|nr:hypothetical protein [Enhygromyxa salina]KIG17458.1 hypothetical protein DB30_03159 [Enhygromyxa salina]
MTEPTDSLDPGDPLAGFQAGQRKRRLVGLASTVVVIAVVGGAWAYLRATGLPPLDPELAQDVAEALDCIDTLPREERAQVAAHAMAELEGERLPAAMVEAFRAGSAVPPDMLSLALVRPFRMTPTRCGGGPPLARRAPTRSRMSRGPGTSTRCSPTAIWADGA